MVQAAKEHATQLLRDSSEGDARAARALAPLVYDELKALARAYLARERKGHTLEPTALVHDAFLRLVDQSRVDARAKTQFLAIAARAMREVLIDYARARKAEKRGGDWRRLALATKFPLSGAPSDDALDVEEALAELARLNDRQARIVELRFYGGLTVEEIAEQLDLSPKTIEKDWRMARAWLHMRLKSGREGIG